MLEPPAVTSSIARNDEAAAGPAPLLSVDALSVDFLRADGTTARAVDNITFDVDAGERVGIVGESGSGKSVTALAILGLTPPTARVSGSIVVQGQEVVGQSERQLVKSRGRIAGMVFQDPQTSFNPVYPIGTQIAEAIRAHRKVRKEAAQRLAVDLLMRVGIPHARERAQDYPHRYSGGMRQRAMVAMALAGNPELLIADEPTTSLDVTVQAQVLELIRDIVEERKMGLILISHDLDLVSAETERIIVMYAGRLAEVAGVEDIRTRSLHPYTASLLAALPRVDQRAGERLATIPGAPPVVGEIPAACAFHPRCWLKETRSRCEEERPVLRALSAQHHVACHFAEELPLHRDERGTTATIQTASASFEAREPLLEEILRVENLVKHFRHGHSFPGRERQIVHALDGVSFALRQGETVAVVGETGCGKSTLARTLVLLDKPTSGRITLRGVDVTEAGRRERSLVRQTVHLVFQDPYASLDPRMTVREVISEPLRAQGYGGRRARAQRVSELLDLVGLDQKFMTRRPHEFSGGQRQRIGIARALAVKPSVVICDEPVSSLDVSVRAQILNLLRDLQEETGVAYLFITHDLSIIPTIAQRILVMYLGQIVEHGNVSDVLRSPRHPYTAALLASAPSRLTSQSRRRRPQGEPASPLSPPSGCRYRLQCWKAQELCANKAPPLREIAPSSWAACHFPERASAGD